jgi:16S rRNA processing protein RimM
LSSSTDPEGPIPPERVVVGYVKRAHGIRGGVLVAVRTDDPGLFVPGVRLGTDAFPETVELRAVRPHKEGLILLLEGVDDRSAAEGLRGAALLITPNQRRTLDDDEYWPEDLIGLEVRDPGGVTIGLVAEVIVTGVQDRLVVDVAGERVEVPFVTPLVPKVDPDGGYIVVAAPPGLLPGSG